MSVSTASQPYTVRIATWSAHHRWLVFGLWFALTIGIFVINIASGGIKTEAPSNNSGASRLESFKARQIYNSGVAQGEPTQDFYLVVSNAMVKVSDPAFKATITRIVEKLNGLAYSADGPAQPIFTRLVDPYSVPTSAGLLAPDGSTARIVGTINGERKLIQKKIVPLKAELKDLQSQATGYELLAYNNTWLNDDINEVVNTDLDGSLKLTLPLTFLILLVAFGAVTAALVPLVLAVTALLAAFGFLGFYSQTVSEVSPYATQLIVLIGLAVAVDYSLFMVTRYRTERRYGRDKMRAIEVASSTAGRAVFFSGIVVMVSLAGLFFLEDIIFRSMAVGTIAVVMISIIGSLTFLPATLSILGNGINWGRIPYFGRDREEGSGFWSNLVGFVMRRPLPLALAAAVLLLALAYPVTHLRLGLVDIDSFPDKIEGVKTLQAMNDKWPQGTTLKLFAVVTNADKSETRAAMERFKEAGLRVKGLGEPSEITLSKNGTVAQVGFTVGGHMNDLANQNLALKLRQELVPAYFKDLPGVQTYVTGAPAQVVDVVKLYTDSMPLVFGFVLGLSFLILLVAFHSLVIPIKAIILNLLSTLASYGAMVLVFQDGWFSQQLGIKEAAVIESWVPVFIFTILFGLSMDYHLFILTRIKEAKDKGASSNEAVARGISVTSGVITSAAAIMVVVFSVFVTMQLVIIRQLGLGLAVAVFIDATVIRCVLLPATMRLLGDWNWYLPGFLNWLPRITIEAEEAEDEVEAKELVKA